MLSVLSRLSWLFLPPLILLLAIFQGYWLFEPDISAWLSLHSWLTPAALGLALLVALQFSRSRLVYTCGLLLLYVPVVAAWLPQIDQFERHRLYFFMLLLSYFMFSRDMGFAITNATKTSGIVLLIGLISIFALPALEPYAYQLSQNIFSQSLPNALLPLAPSAHLTYLLSIVLSIVNLGRLVFRPDNNHNALLFVFMTTLAMYWLPESGLHQLLLIFIALLVAYAIIKDSFTMAFKDELTTIPSRRALMQYIQTLGRNYTVVMSDIDHFKKFNDTHGHDVGDEVLKLVASKLNKVTGGGKAFRFGGEEFVIVFPGKTSSQAEPFVEIVRCAIQDYDIALRTVPRPAKPPKQKSQSPATNKIVKVTTSFGIAQRTKTSHTFEQVMKQADLALYAAKKAGRNCIKLAKQ